MKEQFRKKIESIESKYDRLRKSKPFILKSFPEGLPERGVYLFSEGKKCLYVGRSNNIPRRLRNHVGYGHNQATFAFLLARGMTGRKATYKKEGSREQLLKNKEFKRIFDECRERIRSMSVQTIEEIDPTQQALLEIYVAFVSKAKHNSFDNH